MNRPNRSILAVLLSTSLVGSGCSPSHYGPIAPGYTGMPVLGQNNQRQNDPAQDPTKPRRKPKKPNPHRPPRRPHGNLAQEVCAQFKASLPPNWTQDTIEVPEDPSQPSGTQIKIFYYFEKWTANLTPVLFLNGGPSHSSATFAEAIQQHAKPILDPEDQISFIYMDQRGTGCSDPYPEIKDSNNPDPQTLKRLALYGSAQIAEDAEAIRQKLLGSRSWIIFGQGFGGLVVHRYIVQHPEAIKAAFVQGEALFDQSLPRAELRLASQSKVLQDYLKQFPGDEPILKTLRTILNTPDQRGKLPCTFPDSQHQNSTLLPGDGFCGYAVLLSFAQTHLGNTNEWLSQIHEKLGMLLNSNHSLNEKMVQDTVFGTLFTDNGPKSFFANPHFSIPPNPWAQEVINYTDRNVIPFNSNNCALIYHDLLRTKKINLKNGVNLNECMVQLQQFAPQKTPTQVALVNHPQVLSLPQNLLTVAQFASALKEHSQIPFYWYSSAEDAWVPTALFSQEYKALKGLKNVHYVHFNSTGHDSFLDEPKLWSDLIEEVKQ